MRRPLLKLIAPFIATVVVLVLVVLITGGHKNNTPTTAQAPAPTVTTQGSTGTSTTATTPETGQNLLGNGGGSTGQTVVGKVPPIPKDTPSSHGNPTDPQDYDPTLAYQIKQDEDQHHFVQKLPYQDSTVQINFGPDGTNGTVVQLLVIYKGSQAAAQRHVDRLLSADHDSPRSYSIIWES